MSKKHTLKEKKDRTENKEPSLFLIMLILAGLTVLFLGNFLVTDKMIFGHDLKLLAYYLNSAVRESLVNFKVPFWLTGVSVLGG